MLRTGAFSPLARKAPHCRLSELTELNFRLARSGVWLTSARISCLGSEIGRARERAELRGAFRIAGIPESGREDTLMRDGQDSADGHPLVGTFRMLREDRGEETDRKGYVSGLFEIAGVAQFEHGRLETLGRRMLIIVVQPGLRGGRRSSLDAGGKCEQQCD